MLKNVEVVRVSSDKEKHMMNLEHVLMQENILALENVFRLAQYVSEIWKYRNWLSFTAYYLHLISFAMNSTKAVHRNSRLFV